MSAPAADAGPAIDETADTPPSAPPSEDQIPSPLDGLRAEFAEEVEAKRLFKRLPARNERLVAEYQPLELEDAKKAIEKESDPSLLVSSLKGIWINDPSNVDANDRGLVPLGAYCGSPHADPLCFDKRLTDMLNIKFGSAIDICVSLFEGNLLALSAQSAELGEWSVKTKREDLQDFARR